MHQKLFHLKNDQTYADERKEEREREREREGQMDKDKDSLLTLSNRSLI